MNFSFRDPQEGDKIEQLRIKDVVEQIERHSRSLARKEELSG